MEQKFPGVFWSKHQIINEELFINRTKEWEQGCKWMGRIPTPASPSGKLLPQREPEKAFGNPWGSCPCLWGWWKCSATRHRGGLGLSGSPLRAGPPSQGLISSPSQPIPGRGFSSCPEQVQPSRRQPDRYEGLTQDLSETMNSTRFIIRFLISLRFQSVPGTTHG